MRKGFCFLWARTIFMVSCCLLLSLFWTIAPGRAEAAEGQFGTLTVNLLFSELADRDARLDRIADFVAGKNAASEFVDAILLQEIVGGFLAGTRNSAADLKDKLGERGYRYYLYFRMGEGIPGLLNVGNAILSRPKIIDAKSGSLPIASEEPFQDLVIPIRRNVIMCRMNAPGVGWIHVYNTHLCADCDPSARQQQAGVLLDFVNRTEAAYSDAHTVILGGDLNTNLNQLDHWPVYEMILDEDFIDSYAEFHDCSNCCNSADGLAGCTYGVAGNPYAVDWLTGKPKPTSRVDYIFARELGTFHFANSAVVFNTTPNWVSDHSGVLTGLVIQSLARGEQAAGENLASTQNEMPFDFVLYPNYPNPFNPATTIGFYLPEAAFVDLCIFNEKGQMISTLVHGQMAAGYQEIAWDASGLSTGIYFYRLIADDFLDVRSCLLVK